MSVRVRAFLQARMSSSRYPGKVLAPFRGEPLIRHIVRALEQVLPASDIVVVTSREPSDNPLASYVRSIGIVAYRGPLENVFDRFQMCVREYPCEWILRVSGDSPLLPPQLIRAVLRHADRLDLDLITTIFPRTFPKGMNAELIRVDTFQSIPGEKLSPEDQEHVTPFYYRRHDRFRILNLDSGNPTLAESSLAVDTVDDLRRLEGLSLEELQHVMPPFLMAGIVS
jgi:spore coat polysaccharide biosynthesis protein SpsF